MNRLYVLMFLIPLYVTGCYFGGISKNLESDDIETKSLIYGCVTNLPKGIEQRVLYKQLEPKVDENHAYFTCRVDNGVFYDEETLPRYFRLSHFAWTSEHYSGLMGGSIQQDHILNLPATMPEFRVRNGGELHFLGSFKIMDDNSVVRVGKPTEMEVLEAILPHAKGKKWEELIKERIRKLSH
jgi:hypothetical protein